MNQKGFFKRWKQGILDMTVEQQLKNKIIGILGGIIGLTLALILMIYRRMWGFSIFIFFIIWIQFISYISTRQQLIATKKMLEDLEIKKEDIQSPKIDDEIGNQQ